MTRTVICLVALAALAGTPRRATAEQEYAVDDPVGEDIAGSFFVRRRGTPGPGMPYDESLKELKARAIAAFNEGRFPPGWPLLGTTAGPGYALSWNEPERVKIPRHA